MSEKPVRYNVNLSIRGEANRVVLACSEEEAIEKVKKMLLGSDLQTPKAKLLEAFCWEEFTSWGKVHWADMTDAMKEEWMNKVKRSPTEQEEAPTETAPATQQGEHHEQD